MAKRCYLDTTVICYAAEAPGAADQSGLFLREAPKYGAQLVTSRLVDEEIARMPFKSRRKIRSIYLVRRVHHVSVPHAAVAHVCHALDSTDRHFQDFLHYATAACHHANFVVTSNRRHFLLAARTLTSLPYYPTIVTPQEALEGLSRMKNPPRRRRLRTLRRGVVAYTLAHLEILDDIKRAQRQIAREGLFR